MRDFRVPNPASWTQRSSNDFHRCGKWTTTYCSFILDTTIVSPENSITLFGCVRFECKGRHRALFAGMDRAVHQSGVPGTRTLVAGRYSSRGALQQLWRAAAQCAATTESTAQIEAASSDHLPAEPARSLTSRRIVQSNSERPVGARPLVAWGFGRNVPDATCGSGRTGRLRNLSDKGRLPRGPELPHSTPNTHTFCVLHRTGSIAQRTH